MFQVSYLRLPNLRHHHKILLPKDIADKFATYHGTREFTYVCLENGKQYGLEVKRSEDDAIQIGFTLRALMNCTIGEQITLLKPTEEELGLTNYSFPRNLFRHLVSFNEMFLSKLLGAPVSVLLTQSAYAGDEDRYLVRLHSSLFTRLGAQPGDHVFIERMGKKIIAVAFEDISDEEFKNSAHLAKTRAVGKKTNELPEEFPSYLLARLSPQARAALGIPPKDVSDVVTIKRRVQTQLLAQFNKILLPITVLTLTISATSWSSLIKILLVVSIVPLIVSISLAPIKVRQIPEGHWR